MHFRLSHYMRRGQILMLPILLVLLAGCWPFTGNTRPSTIPPPSLASPIGMPGAGTLSPAIDNVVEQVLTNIQQHGWNPRAVTHGQVTGGLFTNWKMDDPAITNALGLGASEGTQSKHDPQVDLFYLASLAEYRSLHPQDRSFDTDLERIRTLILSEFHNYNLPKGWIYFFLLRSGQLLNDSALINEALGVAQRTYTNWYDPTLGFVYDRSHSPGNYDPNLTLQAGAALIDAGLRTHQPDWVSAGEKTLDHVISVAIDPQYHMFYNNMIVGSNGQDQVQNYQAKPSTQGEGANALIIAYDLTRRQHYLDVANEVLQSMYKVGLWDQQNGGFFFAFDMQKAKLLTSYKETRSQTLVLISFHNYDQAVSGQPYARQEQQLIAVLVNHFYQSNYHGFFYRVTPDFQVYVDKPGSGIGVEDYFTTEAMGSAMDALQQTELVR